MCVLVTQFRLTLCDSMDCSLPDSSVHEILQVRILERPGSMHETGCLGLVHWDDPEGWDGEEGGRGLQDGEHMYTHG